MTDAASFLSPAEIPALRKLNRDGLRTELDYQEPAVSITMLHLNASTGEFDEGDTAEAVIRYANLDAQTGAGGQSTDVSRTAGTADVFAPFTVDIGDRFRLPTGYMATVIAPHPRTEFGIVTFTWQADEGA